MTIAEWILVMFLAVALFVFLVAGIVLIVKLAGLADEIRKIVEAGQGIAAKADDIVDNVNGMTSVGGIVKTFANHVIDKQERRYAEEDATRAAAEEVVSEAFEEAVVKEAAARAAESSDRADRADRARASRADKKKSKK